MTLRLFALAGIAGLLFAGCFGGDSKPKPSPTATPGQSSEAPGPTPVPCPVDEALCEFSRNLESAARDETLAEFMRRSEFGDALARRAQTVWAVTGEEPRVTTIGCPGRAGSGDCRTEFAVTLSSLPAGLEEQDGRGLVVFFFDRLEAGPTLRAISEPPAGRSILVAGGESAFCAPDIARGAGCVNYAFLRWSTGVAEPDAPTPPRPPELRQVSGATTYEVKLAEPYVIQPGELWYFLHVCDACGPGPFPGLSRAYKDTAGNIVIDDLKARTLSLGQPATFTADLSRGVLYLATCSPGNCYYLETGDAESKAPATVYESIDGGITWRLHGEIPSKTSFGGVVGDQVLAHTWGEANTEPRYWFYPSGRDLAKPSRIQEMVFPVVENSTVLWRSQRGAYYDGAGTQLFGPLFDEYYPPQIAAADPQYQHTYLTWTEWPGTPTSWTQSPYFTYAGHVDRDGQLRELYGLAGDTMWITGEFPRSGDAPPALFGRFRFGASVDYERDVSWAGVLDLADGEVHRVTELDGGLRPGQFTLLQGLVTVRQESNEQRTFLRVTGAGNCLNIRQGPSLAAPVLTCLADDVLVGDAGLSELADGRTWVQVAMLNGNFGWAAGEFLK